jgi:signal transduction histidine kinase
MSGAALLVEDNQSHAELIADELETALDGWTLDVAPTLAEARRRMEGKKYDLFVFDFRLPDGDGIQLLREIRDAGVETPTLFVTTASSAKLAVEAMKCGADDYLVKEEGYLTFLPFLIGEVLRRRRLVDERKILEDRLQRAERAATLGYLASGLAHHINNPLATIRTFLQLLPTHYEDQEFRTGYLDMALAESERIRDLVKDIMRATTVPSAGTESYAIQDLVVRAEEAIAGSLAAKNLVYRRNLADGSVLVRTHAEAATCLLVSLLQNAVRFSLEGGEIALETWTDESNGRLVAMVRDKGPGIAPEHRTRIFEPFFTTATDGLGMGLFVAARIADLQNMQLSLETCAPEGAAFRVTFPLAQHVESEARGNGAANDDVAPCEDTVPR